LKAYSFKLFSVTRVNRNEAEARGEFLAVPTGWGSAPYGQDRGFSIDPNILANKFYGFEGQTSELQIAWDGFLIIKDRAVSPYQHAIVRIKVSKCLVILIDERAVKYVAIARTTSSTVTSIFRSTKVQFGHNASRSNSRGVSGGCMSRPCLRAGIYLTHGKLPRRSFQLLG
jgi:hypothetical protein